MKRAVDVALTALLFACAKAAVCAPAPGRASLSRSTDSPPWLASSSPSPLPSTTVAHAPAAGSPSVAFPPSGPWLPSPRPAVVPLGQGELAAGDLAFVRGDLAAARKHYAAAPNRTAATVGLARVRIAGAGAPLDYAAAKGNAHILAAAEDLARCAQSAPSFGPAFVELGRARLLLGDAAGSIRALQKGVQLLPDEPEAHAQLGVALLATGQVPEGLRELSRAADLDPGSAARHGDLGTALLMVGRTTEAIAEYERRASMDGSSAGAHADLGAALLATQAPQRAIAELRRAVQMDPGRATFHSNLGYAWDQAGRADRAIAEYREALRLDAKLVSAWIRLAVALSRDPKGRAEARADLETARVLSPGDPRVEANLEELDRLDGKHASVRPSPP